MEKQTRTIYIVTEVYRDNMDQIDSGKSVIFNTLEEAQRYLSKKYHENEQYLSEEMDSELDLVNNYCWLYFTDDTESKFEIHETEIVL